MYHVLYFTEPAKNRDLDAMVSDFESKYAFTPRECEVFHLMIEGMSNLEIATELYVSESTVKFHVRNILKKTGCENRISMIAQFKAH